MLTPEDETVHLWGLASDRVPLGSSVIARRQSSSDLGLANFLYAVTPRNVGDLEADLADATSAGCSRVIIESRTPPWVEAELLLRGWNIEQELRLVLDAAAPLAESPATHTVRPADDCDPDWSARAEMFRLDHLEEDARHGVTPRSTARTAAIIEHRRDLERHVSYSCAQRLGQVAGFLCHWKAPSGCGVIEDVCATKAPAVSPSPPKSVTPRPTSTPGLVSGPIE
ncbi:hypothetical protein [Amycolatopsis magusensis]|uniref:hypothetical protein n=1 Tax=Amycolatopsis magusensis TaxID=882444 RepID=UPI0024A7DDD4|nr:hypothetical protein [Amycolatopsis magusensis]MDI5979865.1 hypothetical protein [Amycolatopsis magusensis]